MPVLDLWGPFCLFAVSYLLNTGAVVIGVASASNFDYLRELGASFMVDYHDKDIAHSIQSALGQEKVNTAIDLLPW